MKIDNKCGGGAAKSSGAKSFRCGEIDNVDGVIYLSKVNQSTAPDKEEDQSIDWVELKSTDSEVQWQRVGTDDDLYKMLAKQNNCPSTGLPRITEGMCGSGCSMEFKAGKSYIMAVPSENAPDCGCNSPDCGDMVDLIFDVLQDTFDMPDVGAVAAPPTWSAGMCFAEWVKQDKHVTGSTCEGGKIALLYSDGSKVVTPHDCPEVDTDTRLEMGEPVVGADGSVTIPYETINVLTDAVVSSGEIVIPADDECAEHAADFTSPKTARVHGCDENGKGSIPLCDLEKSSTMTVDCSDDKLSAIVDATLASGDIEIEYFSGEKLVNHSDAAWIAAPLTNGLATITDTDFLRDGGYVRMVVKGTCEDSYIVQRFAPCTEDTSCLPQGTIAVAEGVNGVDKLFFDENYISREDRPDGTVFYFYETLGKTLKLSIEDYPCLAIAGQEIQVRVDTNIGIYLYAPWARGHATSYPDYYPNRNARYVQTELELTDTVPYQWGTTIYIDGTLKATTSDLYVLDGGGSNDGLSDTLSFNWITTGADMELAVFQKYLSRQECPASSPGCTIATEPDYAAIDMASISATFFPR